MLTTKSLQSTACPTRTLEATHTTFQMQAVQLIPSALDRCLLCLQHHLPLPMKLPHTDKCRLARGLLFPVLLGDLPVNTPLTRSPQSFPSSLQMHPLETLPGLICSSAGRRTLMASLLPGDLPDKLLYGIEGWYRSPLTRLKCSFHLKPWPVHI